MDSERVHGKALAEKTIACDNKRVIFTPAVKVLNTDHGGGCGPRSEISLNEIEHGSARSSGSSDSVSPSSSKASCGDVVRLNPQNSIGERKEGRESISQPLDVDHACVVKDMLPIVSPPIQVMECPEDYDPDSPGYVFNGDSPTMEGNASSDDFLFSIHMEDESFSLYDSKSADFDKSGQCLGSGQFCQSGEPFKSGKECKVKANESKRSDEMGRFDQISPTTKGVEPDKQLGMGKTTTVDVKQGEKGTVGKPINNVREDLMNNQVDTSRGDFRENKSDGAVSLPKKKKSWKSCYCFMWPSCFCKSSGCSCKWIRPNRLCKWIRWPNCSCKWIRWPGCSCKWIRWPSCSFKWLTCRGCLCERPSNQLKYPRWAGGCFKCLYWPCLKCRC